MVDDITASRRMSQVIKETPNWQLIRATAMTQLAQV
jgi:hypothetical protein